MALKIPLPVKIPAIIKWIYPTYTWDRFDTTSFKKKVIYLTFDDGPIPEVTPWVLKTLRLYQAKATFFCIGDNVKKHPNLFDKVLKEGHRIGNHTHHHLNGWQTHINTYINDVKKADLLISERMKNAQNTPLKYKLFRPPYGKITAKQAKNLQKLGFKIIMYDVIAYDWKQTLKPSTCYNNIIKNARSGSIVVLHDSLKAKDNVYKTLPKLLEYYKNKGYSFETL